MSTDRALEAARRLIATYQFEASRVDGEHAQEIVDVARALTARSGEVEAMRRRVDDLEEFLRGCARQITAMAGGAPAPTGTELALDTAKMHLAKLSAYFMENPNWRRDAEAARAFLAGIPTPPDSQTGDSSASHSD